jgi:hypothetical protein
MLEQLASSTTRAAAALAALALSVSCATEVRGSISASSLEVINDSDYAIIELYITEVDNPDYGPNLLAGDALFPGESIFVPLRCNFYDVLIVDDDGVACELFDVDTCLNNAQFVIRNNTCTVFDATTGEAVKSAPKATAPKATETAPQ